MLEISAKIEMQIKGLFVDADANAGMSYQEEAAQKNVYMSKRLRVQGGDNDIDLWSDADIKHTTMSGSNH